MNTQPNFTPCNDGTNNHPFRKTGRERLSITTQAGEAQSVHEAEYKCPLCSLVEYFPVSEQERQRGIHSTGG